MQAFDLSTLNPEQRQCVETLSGPVMLLAGAGTGKTRVITYRIANLIRQGTPPDRIVALTFTNKAAREMKERVKALVRTDKVTISTFHSFCLGILKKHSARAGLGKKFSILAANDQLDLLKKSVGERMASGTYRMESVQAAISTCKNKLLEAEDIAEKTNIDELQGIDPIVVAELFAIYQRHLRLHQAIDFDDCIYQTYWLLKKEPEILEKVRADFHHMLVDEFQDTNLSQLAIVEQLCAVHRNVCVVGDDDQSIYSWRGAMAEILIHFEEIFPERTLIKLEQNYRCTNVILNAANHVIKNNTKRKEKKLWSTSQLDHPIHVSQRKDDMDEARWIAQRILGLLGKGYKPKDIAVLYRANALAKHMEIALREVNVHYKVYGGQSLFERKEVKDVLAYLRLIADQEHRLAFLRVVNLPARGIGLKTLERLDQIAAGASLFHHLDKLELAGKTLKQIEQFREGIKLFAAQRPASKNDLQQMIQQVISHFHLESEARASSSTLEIGEKRVEFLRRLPDWISQFAEKMFPNWTDFAIEDLIDQLTLNESDSKDDKNSDHCVSLMTVHASKGLEFPCVFVCGVEEGIFPHRNSLLESRGIDEERRLFYVALTRAKHHLHLSYCKERQAVASENKKSRFLGEMPENGILEDFVPQISAEEQRERTRSRLSKLRESLSQT